MNINQWLAKHKNDAVKFHIGCGSKYLQGWCNIDYYPGEVNDTHRGDSIRPDVWADIKKLDLHSPCVDLIMAIHVFEHFYKHECIEILKNYFEILKPGGALIIEMPNLSALKWMTHLPRIKKYNDISTSINIVDSQFYGASWENNPKGYPYHKYVWGRKEFGLMLEEIGYEIRLSTKATLHHYPLRDFCIIAQKPHCATSNKELEIDKIIKIYGNGLKRFKRMFVSLLNICQCI